jgi:hypothetical protein
MPSRYEFDYRLLAVSLLAAVGAVALALRGGHSRQGPVRLALAVSEWFLAMVGLADPSIGLLPAFASVLVAVTAVLIGLGVGILVTKRE